MALAFFFWISTVLIRQLHGYGYGVGTVYYVNGNFIRNGSETHKTGKSWSDPFTSLEPALHLARYNDQIWIAGPYTYIPDTTDRGGCFDSNYNVAIYGGFEGCETTIANRSKNTQKFKVILSGNINDKNSPKDNCYHVLTYRVQLLLDRVTVTGGYADLSVYSNTLFAMDKYGGALMTDGPSQATVLSLNYVEFIDNVAINGGALWFMSSSQNTVDVDITNCRFENNKAILGVFEGGYAGAIYLFLLANISISDTTFIGNKAAVRGGAIYQDYGAFVGCERCVFDSNVAGAYGGAVFGEDRNSQTDGTFPFFQETMFVNNKASLCGGAICWFNGIQGKLIRDKFVDNTAFSGAVTLVDSSSIQQRTKYKGGKGYQVVTDHKNDTSEFSYWDETPSEINITYYQDKIYEKSKNIKEINPFNPSTATICYVDVDNNIMNQDGKTWHTAFQDLQSCLDYLHSIWSLPKEIWVKSGVYRPTQIPQYKIDAGKEKEQHMSFMMYPNIAIYGGFDGSEKRRDQRNIRKNPTILSCYIPPDPTPAPTFKPTRSPKTTRPTRSPNTEKPTKAPKTMRPTRSPVVPTWPTPEPTKTSRPTTQRPSKSPITARPTAPPKTPKPTKHPVTMKPTKAPKTPKPTKEPTWPTPEPTKTPRPTTQRPTKSPITLKPTKSPKTERPTKAPVVPTHKPTRSPVTNKPTKAPKIPTHRPSRSPITLKPTKAPKTERPTMSPQVPTHRPTKSPITKKPTSEPTKRPTRSPVTLKPTKSPKTERPTKAPFTPTMKPTRSPVTLKPTKAPKTERPTMSPQLPTHRPTKETRSPVTARPTKAPFTPTMKPTRSPLTMKPTKSPKTERPTKSPFTPTMKPTRSPVTNKPTRSPRTDRPTESPQIPTPKPTRETRAPQTARPTKDTRSPSPAPTIWTTGSGMGTTEPGVGLRHGHETREIHDRGDRHHDRGRRLLYDERESEDEEEWDEEWNDEWDKYDNDYDDDEEEFYDDDDEGFISGHGHVESDYTNKNPVVCLQIMIAADNVIVDGFIFSQQSNLIFRDRAKPVVANLTTSSPTKTHRPTTLRPTNTARPTKEPITGRPTAPPKTPKPTRSPNTQRPTRFPQPTHAPTTPLPTSWPTKSPSPAPVTNTHKPTQWPTKAPIVKTTKEPTMYPTVTWRSTSMPTEKSKKVKPTKAPKPTMTTLEPTKKTKGKMTALPTESPLAPTKKPKGKMTESPTKDKRSKSTETPTQSPLTVVPTKKPKGKTTPSPTERKRGKGTINPTAWPTSSPLAKAPTKRSRTKGTINPSLSPSKYPSDLPTISPLAPTKKQKSKGTHSPSAWPTVSPLASSSKKSKTKKTESPTKDKRKKGTNSPSEYPTNYPITINPTSSPLISSPSNSKKQKSKSTAPPTSKPKRDKSSPTAPPKRSRRRTLSVDESIIYADANMISTDKVLDSPNFASGAAIYSNASSIQIVNSIFYDLFSPGKGGAVYCIGKTKDENEGAKSPSFTNVAFLANRAISRGGSISADVQCNVQCNQCIFDTNSCSNKGGAMYMDFKSSVVFKDSEFLNGYAGESGGCVAADGGSWTTFEGKNKFIGNMAKWEGGCLYAGSGATPAGTQGFIVPPDLGANSMHFKNNMVGDPIFFEGPVTQSYGQTDVYLWPFNIWRAATPKKAVTQPPDDYPKENPTPFDTPNILIWLVDDFIFPGIYEKYAPVIVEGEVHTSYYATPLPHLQELMDTGMVIPRSYSTSPGCAPSRYGILTGRQAVRSEWAKDRTLMSDSGVNGVNVSVKLTKLGGRDNMYTIPQELKKNGYATGMVGKWHLATSDYEDCDVLDASMDRVMYDKCRDVPRQAGFDFVDAYYPNNIDPDSQSFGHNPEWMVQEAQRFINHSVNVEKKPFFLYFASTLLHEPTVYDSLFRFTIKQTPKGVLEGDDVPENVGMWPRMYLWEKVMEVMQNGMRLNAVAAGMWMDNSLGAMMTYLKRMGLYDDTMIVFLNDHGMLGKFTLFEQGTRIMQIIRYPKLFKAGSVMPDHFITSGADLAEVIFDIAKVQKSPGYVSDGVNWLQDAIDVMANRSSIVYDDEEIGPHRIADFYNSHAVYSEKYKYIWRANKLHNTESGGTYPYSGDLEQLYDLRSDPTERVNLITPYLSEHSTLGRILNKFRQIIVDYNHNKACPLWECTIPHVYGQGNKTYERIRPPHDDNEDDNEEKKKAKSNWMKYLLM